MAKKLSGRNKASSSKRGRGEGSDKPTYRQQIRAKRIAQANKSKNGCAPKLFMLLLPFIVGGAFLLLRS
jgi:hypothetical protein